MAYLKLKQPVKLRSGKTGIIAALDWHEGKVVSAAVDVDEPNIGRQTYHVLAHNIEVI